MNNQRRTVNPCWSHCGVKLCNSEWASFIYPLLVVVLGEGVGYYFRRLQLPSWILPILCPSVAVVFAAECNRTAKKAKFPPPSPSGPKAIRQPKTKADRKHIRGESITNLVTALFYINIAQPYTYTQKNWFTKIFWAFIHMVLEIERLSEAV